MTELTDVTSAAAAFGNDQYSAGYDKGSEDQVSTDLTQINGLTAQITTLIAQLATAVAATQAVQAAFDQYKKDNPVPAPPTPPAPPAQVVGMNFIHATTLPQEPQADVARIYVPLGQKDITTLAEFKRAVADKITHFILSWKDTTIPLWLTTVPKGVVWWGVAHHEPEDMVAATWRSLQALHMPAVRAAGGIPTFIIQAWDLDPSKPHGDPADWIPAKGVCDVAGFDYYPAAKTPTQATVVARMRAFLKQAGLSRYVIGEYGVPVGTPGPSATLVKTFKPLVPDAEALCYWSQTKSPSDFHFSDQTADAWFAAQGK